MPSPALRSRIVPSPNLPVTDSFQERVHTSNTVQALIRRDGSWRQRREDSSGRNWLASPQMLSSSDLELGGQKSQSFCFQFYFIPLSVLVFVALDSMDMNKCTFLFPPSEAHCLRRAFMTPVFQNQEGLEIIPQAKV